MAGGGGGTEGQPEFQSAAMIDVVLVLLTFFMSITTTQVLKVDRSISLPLAPDAVKRDSTPSEAIVNIRWDPQQKKAFYTMDDKEYADMAELSKALGAVKKSGGENVTRGPNPNFRCVIRGDRDCTAWSVSRVMNAAGEAGIAEVTFSTVNKD